MAVISWVVTSHIRPQVGVRWQLSVWVVVRHDGRVEGAETLEGRGRGEVETDFEWRQKCSGWFDSGEHHVPEWRVRKKR